MPHSRIQNGPMVVVAYPGDAKTLLAFDLTTPASRQRLAGFTIAVQPPGVAAYYLQNNLGFEHPERHAQDPAEPAYASINAPFHKFRWLHVPGSVHQGLEPVFGEYEYRVTPRYFDEAGSLLPQDPGLITAVKVQVRPFVEGKVRLGFTRGFTQSQAFVRHFGLKAQIKPKNAPLRFDTQALSGSNAAGEQYSYAQQYQWLGFTARQRLFELLDHVRADQTLSLDLAAYDLDEPDLIAALLELAGQGRVRVILDDAPLHHDASGTEAEDQFQVLFEQAGGTLKRGHFGRYAHNKVMVVYRNGQPEQVLTGSTNFSVTGLYVNANHVLVFDDPGVAGAYAKAFQLAWDTDVKKAAFARSPLAEQPAQFADPAVAETRLSFSPHTEPTARGLLDGIVARIQAESGQPNASVLFAVMELDAGQENPVYQALAGLHESREVFSFGISDNPPGIALYSVGQPNGVLVTGKPVNTQLPPPFNQVPNIGGVGHQVHHKFIVCGFNGPDPTVYCGSSNLALAGEQVNGDNLLMIRDAEVATAFAIEALALVDHFTFLDSMARGSKAKQAAAPAADKQQAAVQAGWFLGTTDRWADKFFDPGDAHCKDRLLFAAPV